MIGHGGLVIRLVVLEEDASDLLRIHFRQNLPFLHRYLNRSLEICYSILGQTKQCKLHMMNKPGTSPLSQGAHHLPFSTQ